MNLSRERKRALMAIDFAFSQLDDYQLDGWARRILNLPERTATIEPFVGCLLPEVKSLDETLIVKKQHKISVSGIDLIKQFDGVIPKLPNVA